jgi:hypothetical protein
MEMVAIAAVRWWDEPSAEPELPDGHHGSVGTSAHGLGMVGRLRGTLANTVTVRFGYTSVLEHGRNPASHSTWARSGPPVFELLVSTPHVAWACSRSAGAEPAGSRLWAKQFCGSPGNNVIWPKSLLD